MILFVILVVIPMTEIALFVLAGDVIGFWPTIAGVLISALIGALALRAQGLSTLRRAQQLSSLDDASTVLADGVFLAVAGLLLLTPGFLTDAIGLLLLIPPVRRAVAQRVIDKAAVHVAGVGGRPRAPGGGARPDGPSGPTGSEPPTEPDEPAARPGAPRTGFPKRPGSPWRDNAEDADILPEDEPRPPKR